MRHAPADRSLFVVPRDEKLGFVRVTCFFPDVFPMRIAPAEHFFHRVEGVDYMMR